MSIHYDPMLAKVISYAPTRRQAALVLADALARARLHGVRTNRELLVNVLRHPAFLDGATDTAFFDTHGLAQLSAPLADDAVVRLSAIAAALADAAHNRATAQTSGAGLDPQRLAKPAVRPPGQELPRRRRHRAPRRIPFHENRISAARRRVGAAGVGHRGPGRC